MKENEMIQHYLNYEEKLSAYELALETISFDQATIAPRSGNAFRNEKSSFLQGEMFSILVDPINIKVMESILTIDELDPILKEQLKQRLRSIKDLRILPKDLYVDYNLIIANSQSAWEEAKNKNDYKLFEPHLLQVIDKTKIVLSYRDEPLSTYEKLLDDYELGMTIDKYDAFFQLIKEKIVPLIKEIQVRGRKIDNSPLMGYYPEKDQIQFMEVLKQYLGFDESSCYMGVSAHPFTAAFSCNDVRITINYDEHALTSSIFSIIHEYGHALYDLNVDEKFSGSILSTNMSMGMHESQSRLMENCLARTTSFWQPNYEALKKIFPSLLKDIDLDSFVDMVNVAEPTLIRTDADELTYSLHILIRYELEKAIFDENLDCSALDQLWADKYEEYLGIRPKNAAEGILQDIHWSAASFGYFPTYALGSAYASQFYHQLKKELDIDQILKDGEFFKINNWLKEKIHQYGSYLHSDDILKNVCNESFNPMYYIDYLTNKYRKLYQLD